MQVTLRLLIDRQPESDRILKDTMLQYTQSYNRVAVAGWKSRVTNSVELHRATYAMEREKTALPSQLVCSARVKASESLKSVAAKIRADRKTAMPVSRNCSIRYDARSATVRLLHGFATLASVAGRQQVSFRLLPHQERFRDWKVCSSDLIVDRKKRLWLHVVVHGDGSKAEPTGVVCGADLGVTRSAVCSNNRFFGSARIPEISDRYFRLRRALQSKGTRSANRHLRRLARRENGFRRNADHLISRQLIDSLKAGDTLVLEELTHIRDRVRARKAQRRRIHNWSFARLRSFLEYKAELSGVHLEFLDPRNSSRRCFRCGHIAKSNRRTQSLFCCRKCGFAINADLNAARNLAHFYLVRQGMSLPDGLPVNQPIVGTVSVRHALVPASSVL